MPGIIDTHCHLTYPPLHDQLSAVLARAHANQVTHMITVGTDPHDAHRAVQLAQQHPGVYAAVGLHPNHAHQWLDRPALIEPLRELARQSGVVALGEMGLDRYHHEPPMEVQLPSFEWQLELAHQIAKPIIIHNRLATDDTLAVLRRCGLPGSRFVFHCFTGTAAELDAILELGAMVSFTGIITFKNAAELASLTTRVPLDRLMIETDAPYLTPEPHRKIKINEPGFVPWVGKKLAALRGMNEADFFAAMWANSCRFFGLAVG